MLKKIALVAIGMSFFIFLVAQLIIERYSSQPDIVLEISQKLRPVESQEKSTQKYQKKPGTQGGFIENSENNDSGNDKQNEDPPASEPVIIEDTQFQNGVKNDVISLSDESLGLSWIELGSAETEEPPEEDLPQVPRNGLAAWLKFNEAATWEENQRTAIDSTGLNSVKVFDDTKNNNVWEGPKSSPGIFSGKLAAKMDGAKDRMETQNFQGFTGDYAITIWTKTDKLPQPVNSSIISNSKQGASKSSFQIEIKDSGSGPAYSFYTNANHELVPVLINEWQFIALSFDSKTPTGTNGSKRLLTYYYGTKGNALQKGLIELDPNESNNFSQLFIGRNRNNDNYFTGDIDNITVYNRTLSEAEITEIKQYDEGGEQQDNPPPPIYKGTYTSEIFDLKGVKKLTKLSWMPDIPHNKPFINNRVNETEYNFNNMDMSNNFILYHLDEQSWNGTQNEVIDSSGNQNHATALGPTPDKDSLYQKAALFNNPTGSNCIESGTLANSDLRNGFFTSFLLKFTQSNKHVDILNYNSAELQGIMSIRFNPDTKKLILSLNTDKNNYAVEKSLTPSNAYNHVIASWDPVSNYLRLAVNGQQEQKIISGIVRPGNKVVLGCRASNNTYSNFSGLVDEFAFFNRPLKENESLIIEKRLQEKRLGIQLKACSKSDCSDAEFIGPDGTSNSFFTENMNLSKSLPAYDIASLNLSGAYLQYQVTLKPLDFSFYSPKLYKIRIETE